MMVVKERLGCKTILKPNPMGKLIDPDAFRINKSSRISVSRCRRYPEVGVNLRLFRMEVYLVKGSGIRMQVSSSYTSTKNSSAEISSIKASLSALWFRAVGWLLPSTSLATHRPRWDRIHSSASSLPRGTARRPWSL